ncbi:UNVERIFIED_CONTAM: hypothetical protein PYX00_010889 [Menopon gallinae]|uniref:Uncharacterized protein n=1 Tax=Menopon gallinae TaxID=328185 RepID=A0AAW2H6J6_9NEOP
MLLQHPYKGDNHAKRKTPCRKEWKRIAEIRSMFARGIEEVKRNTIELSNTIGEMRETLAYEGDLRGKAASGLKDRIRERIESIKRVVSGDLRTVDVFMKDVDEGRALRSMHSASAEDLKREMRQMQWLATCLRDYLALLESSHEQLGKVGSGVQAEGGCKKSTDTVAEFKRALHKIMKQISAHETSESVKRQEELLQRGQYNHVQQSQYYGPRGPHSYYPSSTAPTYYSFRYLSSSTPQFNSHRYGYHQSYGSRRL